MIYIRFETRKNTIYVFSLAEYNTHNIQLFFNDVFKHIMDLPDVCKSLMFAELGETFNFSCVNYSKVFNRFYTLIPKYYGGK